MTTIAVREQNRATKKYKVVARYRATYSRPHGRNNVGRVLKMKRLPIEKEKTTP